MIITPAHFVSQTVKAYDAQTGELLGFNFQVDTDTGDAIYFKKNEEGLLITYRYHGKVHLEFDKSDWSQKFDHDTGTFSAKCTTCKQMFMGTKGRVYCTTCVE